eukprot:326291-Rhodomonas_salina.1
MGRRLKHRELRAGGARWRRVAASWRRVGALLKVRHTLWPRHGPGFRVLGRGERWLSLHSATKVFCCEFVRKDVTDRFTGLRGPWFKFSINHHDALAVRLAHSGPLAVREHVPGYTVYRVAGCPRPGWKWTRRSLIESGQPEDMDSGSLSGYLYLKSGHSTDTNCTAI